MVSSRFILVNFVLYSSGIVQSMKIPGKLQRSRRRLGPTMEIPCWESEGDTVIRHLPVMREFNFYMKNIYTERQGGKVLDIQVKYRFTIPPNYKELRTYIASEVNNPETFFVGADPKNPEDKMDLWWEELAEAVGRNIMLKWRGQYSEDHGYDAGCVTAISLSMEVHEDMRDGQKEKYKQESQHGCIITIGDITPLAPTTFVQKGIDNLMPPRYFQHEKENMTQLAEIVKYFEDKHTKMKCIVPNPGLTVSLKQLISFNNRVPEECVAALYG